MGRTRRNAGLRDYAALADKYCGDVISGEIDACEWVRAACIRQGNDLKRPASVEFPWHFDRKKAAHVCAFVEKLPHVKGKWKSATIELEPWQCFILGTIFGWIDAEGMRRFRKALVVIPRKNAKSTMAAGVGLYLLVMDAENGAEVYSAASTRDQAKIVWGEYAHRMVSRMPEFCARYGIAPMAHSITVENTSSFFRPLSRDSDTLEGLNVHGAIIDELHAHKNREVFDVLDDATGSRRQPLMFIISTEGDDSVGVFPEQVDYAKQVLRGTHSDESYFAVIYTLDAADDWTSPLSWKKANPNLGVSVLDRDMEVRCQQAIANPSSQSSFLTKRLNVRVGESEAYFNMLAWQSICRDTSLKLEDFYGRDCIMALDLASKRDLTAKVYLFRQGPKLLVFGRYYLPGDMLSPDNQNNDLYRGWAASGFLTVTEGNVTDYSLVESQLIEDGREFRPIQIGVDPNYNAAHLTTRLMAAGLPMIDVPQNRPTFSEPMKLLDAMIVAGQIKHCGDPVLTWAIGNVKGKEDEKGNVYPMKSRDIKKIDPAVALISALSLQLRQQDDVSVYAKPETAVM